MVRFSIAVCGHVRAIYPLLSCLPLSLRVMKENPKFLVARTGITRKSSNRCSSTNDTWVFPHFWRISSPFLFLSMEQQVRAYLPNGKQMKKMRVLTLPIQNEKNWGLQLDMHQYDFFFFSWVRILFSFSNHQYKLLMPTTTVFFYASAFGNGIKHWKVI